MAGPDLRDPVFSAAERRHLTRLIEKAIKDCAQTIDSASRHYDTRTQQEALALTVLDGLTLAVINGFFPNHAEAVKALSLHGQHCLVRLAQIAKRPLQ